MTKSITREDYIKFIEKGQNEVSLVSSKCKSRLLEYGHSFLNTGIEKVVEIADAKRIIVRIVTDVTMNDDEPESL